MASTKKSRTTSSGGGGNNKDNDKEEKRKKPMFSQEEKQAILEYFTGQKTREEARIGCMIPSTTFDGHVNKVAKGMGKVNATQLVKEIKERIAATPDKKSSIIEKTKADMDKYFHSRPKPKTNLERQIALIDRRLEKDPNYIRNRNKKYKKSAAEKEKKQKEETVKDKRKVLKRPRNDNDNNQNQRRKISGATGRGISASSDASDSDDLSFGRGSSAAADDGSEFPFAAKVLKRPPISNNRSLARITRKRKWEASTKKNNNNQNQQRKISGATGKGISGIDSSSSSSDDDDDDDGLGLDFSEHLEDNGDDSSLRSGSDTSNEEGISSIDSSSDDEDDDDDDDDDAAASYTLPFDDNDDPHYFDHTAAAVSHREFIEGIMDQIKNGSVPLRPLPAHLNDLFDFLDESKRIDDIICARILAGTLSSATDLAPDPAVAAAVAAAAAAVANVMDGGGGGGGGGGVNPNNNKKPPPVQHPVSPHPVPPQALPPDAPPEKLEDVFNIVWVPPDGNCLFWMVMKWLQRNRGIPIGRVKDFRKDLERWATENWTNLTSTYPYFRKMAFHRKKTIFLANLTSVYEDGMGDIEEGCAWKYWGDADFVFPLICFKYRVNICSYQNHLDKTACYIFSYTGGENAKIQDLNYVLTKGLPPQFESSRHHPTLFTKYVNRNHFELLEPMNSRSRLSRPPGQKEELHGGTN